VRDATYEWMSWVVPILVVEFFISWLPSIKKIPAARGLAPQPVQNK